MAENERRYAVNSLVLPVSGLLHPRRDLRLGGKFSLTVGKQHS